MAITSDRSGLPLAASGAILNATALAAQLQDYEADSYSHEFTCTGYYTTAYANRLLFGTDGIEFDADGASIRVLEPEEVAETQSAIAQLPICVVSLELVSNVYVNPSDIPEDAEATCMSPAEYQEPQICRTNKPTEAEQLPRPEGGGPALEVV